MRIVFESDLLMPTVSKAISILTDRAIVCIDDIHYDKVKGNVDVYIQRRELTGFKKKFWGEMQPIYSQSMIKSLLTVRQIEEINIVVDDRLLADCKSCFSVLFGLKVDENNLYLGSAEEIQGKQLCQIFIKVKNLNIEYGDEVEK